MGMYTNGDYMHVLEECKKETDQVFCKRTCKCSSQNVCSKEWRDQVSGACKGSTNAKMCRVRAQQADNRTLERQESK